jgi:hypothetical protein
VIFGVYPGGGAGAATGMALGPPDVPERVLTALDALQGEERLPLTVHCYEVFGDPAGHVLRQTPADPARYVTPSRRLDLVVQYQSRREDIDGYCAFLRDAIDRYGDALATLQVAEEPNVVGNPSIRR